MGIFYSTMHSIYFFNIFNAKYLGNKRVQEVRLNGMRRIAIAICILGVFLASVSGSGQDAIFAIVVTFILAWIVDGFGSK
jgi:hypothetical protein